VTTGMRTDLGRVEESARLAGRLSGQIAREIELGDRLVSESGKGNLAVEYELVSDTVHALQSVLARRPGLSADEMELVAELESRLSELEIRHAFGHVLREVGRDASADSARNAAQADVASVFGDIDRIGLLEQARVAAAVSRLVARAGRQTILFAVVIAGALVLALITVSRTAALRAAEQRYEQLFQRSPAGMIRVALDGRILDCNLAAARIFGYDTQEALMADPISERYFNVAEGKELIGRLEQASPMTDLERCLRRKDGSPVWLLTTITVCAGQNGAPIYEGMMIDITDKKRLQVGHLHAQKLEAVGALAAGVAHEINTPVQFVTDNTRFLRDSFTGVTDMISAYEKAFSCIPQGAVSAETLDQVTAGRERADWDYLKAELPKAFEQMQDGLGRVTQIVGAMREFSHVDQSTEMAAADINRALESTLIVSGNTYKYVARVETQFADLPPVMCHIGDLNQVFLNLVINAAHAIEDAVAGTRRLGSIGVQTRRDGDWVEINVSDTGAGIPEAIRYRVFDPFFTTKVVGRGSGQGLTLARAIVVDKHRGTITFDSEVGRGTTFHVRLPINGTRAASPTFAG
jgi:PAS domain S-box-containing protein